MKEALRNIVWRSAVQLRNAAKRAGVSDSFEGMLLYWGPRLVPPPATEVEVAVHGGMTMSVPPGVPSARTFQAGLYEPDVTTTFHQLLKEGMTVLDVGASVGYYTLLASALVGDSGRVWAFEPDAQAYAYLIRNIQANDCRNVTAVNKAVSDRAGWASLVGGEAERRFLTQDDGWGEGAAVEAITVDSLRERLAPVDLIKMDIEGGEPRALQGMRKVSEASPNLRLIMEWCTPFLKRSGATPQSVAAQLGELGFVRYELLERNAGAIPLSHGLPKGRAVYNLLLSKR